MHNHLLQFYAGVFSLFICCTRIATSWVTGLRRRCWRHEMTLTVMLRMHTANGCATRS